MKSFSPWLETVSLSLTLAEISKKGTKSLFWALSTKKEDAKRVIWLHFLKIWAKVKTFWD